MRTIRPLGHDCCLPGRAACVRLTSNNCSEPCHREQASAEKALGRLPNSRAASDASEPSGRSVEWIADNKVVGCCDFEASAGELPACRSTVISIVSISAADANRVQHATTVVTATSPNFTSQHAITTTQPSNPPTLAVRC